jgi:hypothetical protein
VGETGRVGDRETNVRLLVGHFVSAGGVGYASAAGVDRFGVAGGDVERNLKELGGVGRPWLIGLGPVAFDVDTDSGLERDERVGVSSEITLGPLGRLGGVIGVEGKFVLKGGGGSTIESKPRSRRTESGTTPEWRGREPFEFGGVSGTES